MLRIGTLTAAAGLLAWLGLKSRSAKKQNGSKPANVGEHKSNVGEHKFDLETHSPPQADQCAPRNPPQACLVFCGSRSGSQPAYLEAARAFAKELCERKLQLVYGGGTIGIMGELARSMHDGGAQILGVIPKALSPREICGPMIGQTVVVPDMHTRKQLMFRNADWIVALPGGYGTFEELFEMITWQQLGIHTKPIGVLNTAGFYEPLRKMLQHAVSEGFVAEKFANIVVFADSPAELCERMAKHTPPVSDIRWIQDTAQA